VREARASEFVAEGRAESGAGSGARDATGARSGNRAKAGDSAKSSARAEAVAPSGGGVAAPPAPEVGPETLAPVEVGEPSANGAHGPQPVEIDATLGPALVAVVAGEGLEKLFRSYGVEHIVRGGQTANPSTGELLRIARLAKSREVLLLPNNPNVRLAAEQAAQICEERRLVVVPTRNAAEGIAAVLAYRPTVDAATNAGPMTAAGRGLATLQVTEAVRDARIGGKKVKKGQTIALDPDDGLVAVDSDRDRAVLKAVDTFAAGTELITLYYGADSDLADAEAIGRKIGERVGAEWEVVPGGQPHYRYLISAE
jgi:dihydroxyacetone kinase-like predicted kinase